MAGENQLNLDHKELFGGPPSPFDVVMNVAQTMGVTTYQVSDKVFNFFLTPPTFWTEFHLELGFGVGANFVRAGRLSHLRFSGPVSANRFSDFDIDVTTLSFRGRPGIAAGQGDEFRFRLDVPDLTTENNRFTLRQTPTVVPEPPSIMLLGIGTLGLLGCVWRHRRQEQLGREDRKMGSKWRFLMNMRILVLLTFAVSGLCTINIKLAEAAAITLGTTGWSASWAPIQNGDMTTGDLVDVSFGPAETLVKTVTFRTFQPVVITFLQTMAGMDSPNAGGLRIPMDEILKNETGTSWGAFREELIDIVPVCDDASLNNADMCAVTTAGRQPATRNIGTNAHPQFPHFHNESAMKTNPFNQLFAGGDTKGFFQVQGGSVINGGEWNPRGIVIHEPVVQGFMRVFNLIEQPIQLLPPPTAIPEPSTLVLYSVGILVLIHCRRRQKRNFSKSPGKHFPQTVQNMVSMPA